MFSPNATWTNRIGLLVATAAALLVLVDRSGFWPGTRPYATLLYGWVLLLSGFALLLGIANVLWVHLWRVVKGQEEWVLSLLLIGVLMAVLLLGLLAPSGTTSPIMEWVFDSVIAPSQAALFALTAFFLMAAAYQFLRLSHPGGVWILLGVFLTLLVQTPFTQANLPGILVDFVDWLLIWPVMAALRGALLGVGLAAVLTGFTLYLRHR